MNASVELYEMLLTVVDQYNYGKDTIIKMASPMANIYCILIKKGLKTLDEVPEKIKADVIELLEQDK